MQKLCHDYRLESRVLILCLAVRRRRLEGEWPEAEATVESEAGSVWCECAPEDTKEETDPCRRRKKVSHQREER